ncbi:divergent polysaccharide deacetylase family protein [Primorskyibacter flagellatus]|uniref:divergent polysaccharide deacetylase family protein n=1 Tax=Primorskyibacter flagellatus TaxID=1387277 RepID=UPI0016654707|nr:divergent polysaccharide deacetylase family protein [Primorskyibacter flagellatus]
MSHARRQRQGAGQAKDGSDGTSGQGQKTGFEPGGQESGTLLRGIILGAAYGLVLGSTALAVLSLSTALPPGPPPELGTAEVPESYGPADPDGAAGLPDRLPLSQPAPERAGVQGDAVRGDAPGADGLAALTPETRDTAAAPSPDAAAGQPEAPDAEPLADMPEVAPVAPVLPSPLARAPGEPLPEPAPEIATEPALPPRAAPGEEVTGFPTGDLTEAADAPEPVRDASGAAGGDTDVAEGAVPGAAAVPDEDGLADAGGVAPGVSVSEGSDSAVDPEADVAAQGTSASDATSGTVASGASMPEKSATGTVVTENAAPERSGAEATAPEPSTAETTATDSVAPEAEAPESDTIVAEAPAPEIATPTPSDPLRPRTSALPRADETGDAAPRALPGQPAARLTETAPDTASDTAEAGPPADPAADPEVEDTRPPIDRFAAPFENPEGQPLLSIVLIDDGTGGAELPDRFPYPISIAIPAARPDAAEAMARARAAGFEVLALADLPRGATPQDLETSAAAWFAALPEAVAVMEPPERPLQSGRALGEQLAAVLAETGHGLLLYPEGLDTARKLAERRGVPAATVFRDLDAEGQGESVIRRFLDNSAFRAGQEGAVILVARLRPETLQALLVWGLADRAGRVALAPVSHALKAE